MKKLFLFIGVCWLVGGCRKTVEQVKLDLVVQAMTNGEWRISNFIHNGTNITASFSNYKFKYYSNKTVDAIHNGTVQQTGAWDGNASNMTTSADFPGAASPLDLVNGTWQIDSNSWTYVVASQSGPGGAKVMRLDKL